MHGDGSLQTRRGILTDERVDGPKGDPAAASGRQRMGRVHSAEGTEFGTVSAGVGVGAFRRGVTK